MLEFFKLVLLFVSTVNAAGILYPKPSETRDLISLNGLWNFVLNQTSNSADAQLIPVPASYNDISPEFQVRDHVGQVWYQRTFYPPKSWKNQKVWIRFSSVSYAAKVVINGKEAVSHSIGHLPFQADVTALVKLGEENTIQVVVDNRLDAFTLPQGTLQRLSSGRIKQNYYIDYFNYAGIDRPVVLYSTPNTHIEDISVATTLDGANGVVHYTVKVNGSQEVSAHVSLVDREDKLVVSGAGLGGELQVPNAHLWWPILMDPNPGYLYTLVVELHDSNKNVVDQYNQSVGIRVISWDASSLKINNKPIYLRGFGRYEDSDFRGRGLDFALLARDYNLIKWIGANTIRTGHYPLSEEEMDLADRVGLIVINEVSSDQTAHFSDELKENHIRALTELYQRDKNRPSTIIWSVANEPESQQTPAIAYFRDIFGAIKNLDKSRPVLFVSNKQPDNDHVAQYSDLISFSVYDAWETNTGDFDQVVPDVGALVKKWHSAFNKPIIIGAYGAETQEGLHYLPTYVWSEEYQEALLSEYFRVFDELKNSGILIGELSYSFTDFRTAQNFLRVGGSKKGLFMRNRQPKASAHLMRKRFWALAEDFDKVAPPKDLNEYVHTKRSSVY